MVIDDEPDLTLNGLRSKLRRMAAQHGQLGLVVIDEQQKFGVFERARRRHATLDPHYLVMTATPIPRTVGLTLYGDLDVSTLPDQDCCQLFTPKHPATKATAAIVEAAEQVLPLDEFVETAVRGAVEEQFEFPRV